MRSGLVVTLAVAIIGVVGVYSKSHKSPAVQSANTAAVSPARTPASKQSVNSNPDVPLVTTYKDGVYNGETERTEYGMVQVAAVISGGKIADIEFLRMPGPEGHSREVTAFSESPLKQSTLNNQNAHVDFVSGATTTCQAYEQSLQAALDQAA